MGVIACCACACLTTAAAAFCLLARLNNTQ
uniref:Uncharacterized protein n=1 Tax=Arundo donax TaxID=35708 RepID=A0A0A9BIP9_ARUDO